MRTRIFNKMTHNEVQAYLDRGGNTIFLGVGVVETHGNLPIDCETIGPEAKAVLLAEKADGLAMINLPYFYPGGTVISNATVRLSIMDCIDYLRKICFSLVEQGFKHIFMITGHGPSALYVNAFIRDFFEETLIHPCHLSNLSGKPFDFSAPADPEAFKRLSYSTYGAYKIMGQMEYLPVDPNVEKQEAERMPTDPRMDRFSRMAFGFGGICAQIYSDPRQHAGGLIFKSEEERLEACKLGEQVLREEVDACPINEYIAALDAYQTYVQEVYAKQPRIRRMHE